MKSRIFVMLISALFVLGIGSAVPGYGGINDSKGPPGIEGIEYNMDQSVMNAQLEKATIEVCFTYAEDHSLTYVEVKIDDNKLEKGDLFVGQFNHAMPTYRRPERKSNPMNYSFKMTNADERYAPRGKLINFALGS